MKPDEVSLKMLKMDSLLDQLLSLLNQETEFYESMHSVIQKEKDAVIRSELKALNEAGKEKEHLVLKLRIVEQNRVQVVRRLAGMLGNAPQDLTLAMIVQRIGEPYASQLKECCANLALLLDRVQTQNHRNKTLFEHSLDLLRGSFNLLSELMASNTVYHRTGDIRSTKRIGQIVHGEI